MDVLEEPESVDSDVVGNLGPLRGLIGTWEGAEGLDVAAGPSGPKETPYRERATFEPVGPVVNGSQVLYGLRYTMVAWPLGEQDPFHEELGYWLWDAQAGQVMRCFMIPRGVTVIACGAAAPDATSFELRAEAGAPASGILTNPSRAGALKTVRYSVEVSIGPGERFGYSEDSVLQIEGREELFHHTDRNTLARVFADAA